ncbi:MAG: NAD-dependent deacylase [Prevotellaceae bacterium]|jgi:NAD-dependent deacetylase|nr:NAD-dependent deacylase [Prevotellaceae bacterium]
MKKKLAVLTGAGISAESGIKTFRDSGGLWEEYDVMEVASIDGWNKNPQLVLEFYNQRRRQLETAQPNTAHRILAELENDFDVNIITQNVDNLHERAGSTSILHLHGLLTQARSILDDSLIYDIGYADIKPGDTCEIGSQLRPHIVWFGEAVPLILTAAELVMQADILAVVGTSLNVYPAAGLVGYLDSNKPIFLIDPNDVSISRRKELTVIKEKASIGVEKLRKLLLAEYL